MNPQRFEQACNRARYWAKELDESARHRYLDPERHAIARAEAAVAFDELVVATREYIIRTKDT